MIPLLLSIVFFAFILQRIFFHPLSKIPGPKLAALTSLYYTFHEFYGDRHLFINSLHKKYGPFVRIGPKYVSISEPSMVKEIYGVASWDKPKGGWYTHFGAYGEDNMFSTWEGKEHLRRKKVINSMYKKTFLLTKPAMTEFLVRNTRNLVNAIAEEANKSADGVVDVYLILHRYATDVIAEFTYGPQGSTNSLVDTKYRHVAEQFALSHRRMYQLCQIHLPYLTEIYTRIKKALSNDKRIGVFEFGWLAVQNVKAEKVLDSEESLASLMMSNPEQFSDAYIASELIDHMIAGSDTTANTLTYLLHELSRPRNQAFQKRLHDEVANALRSGKPSLSELDKLPILEAILREGLRVFSAIPFLEPRQVPAGGRVLNNYFLPEFTTVGIQAYTLHHDESIFPDANTFNPDRWLEADEETVKIMNRSFWAFGSGQRGCIAEYLAWLEMKIAVAMLYDRFRTEIYAGFKDEEMELDDQISSIVPIARRCMLIFKSWD